MINGTVLAGLFAITIGSPCCPTQIRLHNLIRCSWIARVYFAVVLCRVSFTNNFIVEIVLGSWAIAGLLAPSLGPPFVQAQFEGRLQELEVKRASFRGWAKNVLHRINTQLPFEKGTAMFGQYMFVLDFIVAMRSVYIAAM